LQTGEALSEIFSPYFINIAIFIPVNHFFFGHTLHFHLRLRAFCPRVTSQDRNEQGISQRKSLGRWLPVSCKVCWTWAQAPAYRDCELFTL